MDGKSTPMENILCAVMVIVVILGAALAPHVANCVMTSIPPKVGTQEWLQRLPREVVLTDEEVEAISDHSHALLSGVDAGELNAESYDAFFKVNSSGEVVEVILAERNLNDVQRSKGGEKE